MFSILATFAEMKKAFFLFSFFAHFISSEFSFVDRPLLDAVDDDDADDADDHDDTADTADNDNSVEKKERRRCQSQITPRQKMNLKKKSLIFC